MTAHSISILLELKMTSVGPYAGQKLYSVEGHAKCPTVPQRRELVTGTRAAGQGSK